MILDSLDHPIVQAPMGGGPSTVELAAAVCEAGALGFLAAAYRSAEDVRAEIRELRERTPRPFGVNVFVPGSPAADPAALERYVDGLGPAAAAPRWDDDGWEDKLAVLREERVPLASFTFGCPRPEDIRALRPAEVWVTVTNPTEARAARDAGADGLVLQGVEAGGHQGSFADGERVERLTTLTLLRLVAATVDLPLVAAGGVADGAALAAVLAAGARAGQVGSALMLADEAGTHPAQREALGGDAPTELTRAFTGRAARGIANAFMREHRDAPIAYPEVHHATSPLRAAARARGDTDGFNLWAGQAYRLAKPGPAADLIREMSAEARRALTEAQERLDLKHSHSH